MDYESWRNLYMEVNGIDKLDLDGDWEKEIKNLYDKANEPPEMTIINEDTGEGYKFTKPKEEKELEHSIKTEINTIKQYAGFNRERIVELEQKVDSEHDPNINDKIEKLEDLIYFRFKLGNKGDFYFSNVIKSASANAKKIWELEERENLHYHCFREMSKWLLKIGRQQKKMEQKLESIKPMNNLELQTLRERCDTLKYEIAVERDRNNILSAVIKEFLYYYHNKGVNWVYRDGETKQKDIMKMIKKLDGTSTEGEPSDEYLDHIWNDGKEAEFDDCKECHKGVGELCVECKPELFKEEQEDERRIRAMDHMIEMDLGKEADKLEEEFDLGEAINATHDAYNPKKEAEPDCNTCSLLINMIKDHKAKMNKQRAEFLEDLISINELNRGMSVIRVQKIYDKTTELREKWEGRKN